MYVSPLRSFNKEETPSTTRPSAEKHLSISDFKKLWRHFSRMLQPLIPAKAGNSVFSTDLSSLDSRLGGSNTMGVLYEKTPPLRFNNCNVTDFKKAEPFPPPKRRFRKRLSADRSVSLWQKRGLEESPPCKNLSKPLVGKNRLPVAQNVKHRSPLGRRRQNRLGHHRQHIPLDFYPKAEPPFGAFHGKAKLIFAGDFLQHLTGFLLLGLVAMLC